MKEDRKAARRMQIEAAAYEVLAERGFVGASMLEIAKRAKASNETLYRWYGDKLGLFASMVTGNAAAGMEKLAQPLEQEQPLVDRLTDFGTALLIGVLSERAILLNRIAAADPSGDLGRTLAEHGRERVVPMLHALFEAEELGQAFGTVDEAVETYLSFLVGDMQSRRFIGRMAEPDPEFCRVRASKSARYFLTLASAQ